MELTMNHVFVWFILINLIVTLKNNQSTSKTAQMLYWAHMEEIEKNKRQFGGDPKPFD